MADRGLRTRQNKGEELRKTFEERRQLAKSGIKQVDLLEDDEDDAPVIETMDEDEYRAFVQKRKEGGSFVVDDDGTGYMDDGEEHYWDANQGGDSDGIDEPTAAEELARKARKSNKKKRHEEIMLAENNKNNIGSMFKRIAQQNVTGSAGPAVGPSSNSKAAEREGAEEDAVMNDTSLDNMIQNMLKAPKPKRAKPAPKRRKIVAATPKAVKSKKVVTEQHAGEEEEEETTSVKLDNQDSENEQQTMEESTPEVKQETPESSTNANKKEVENDDEPAEDDSKTLTTKEKLLARAKSRPIKARARLPKPTTVAVQAPQPVQGENNAPALTTDASWQNVMTAADAGKVSDSAPKPVQGSTTELPMEKDEDGEECLPFYWLDMYENSYAQPGVVYMIGKVKDNNTGNFVSCCVKISNIERELYVLPRSETPSGKPVEKMMVYNEIKESLSKIMPATEGREFRCKFVERNYAFELPGIPRETTEYLKCVYPMSAEKGKKLDSSGGVTYSHVFGTNQSAIEQLVLTRDLMGPCWLNLHGVEPSSGGFSWCKKEATMDDPENIIKIMKQPPLPTLRVLSLSLKTVVNKKTHHHEVVAASAFLKEQFKLENVTGEELESPAEIKYFTILRAPSQGAMHSDMVAALPPDFKAHVNRDQNLKQHLMIQGNERALLQCFLAQLHHLDPDVVLGHNIAGFELDVLLSRMQHHKIAHWSKVGRLKRTKMPRARAKGGSSGLESFGNNLTPGRLLLDSYLTARELLYGERNFTLTELCKTQLNVTRTSVDPLDVPLYYATTQQLLALVQNTVSDAWLTYRLAVRLEALPLTLQLTTLGGNLWRRTLSGGRAERIEYLLLHEFYRRDYILPDKESMFKKADKNKPQKKKSISARRKPAYAGGLVLEPKKGLYDKFVLLLDFNSLYPSIIQEYNICFTTVVRPSLNNDDEQVVNTIGGEDEADDVGAQAVDSGEIDIPPLPEDRSTLAILPSVIRTLVQRRRDVKRLIKSERDPNKLQQLDVKQKALKITANSMYGCLGFSHSRFFAKPLAALVTSQGREILQNTVNTAQNKLGLEVIYGDTDSIMINTASTDLQKVKEIARQVKREINKLYKLLEIEMDGIYKSMLLLKKKKYAAITIVEQRAPDGKTIITEKKETKGLDLVRRDWCPLSRSIGEKVLESILSGKSCDEVVDEIHDALTELAERVRSDKVPVAEYVVTKGLNKSPNDYPNAKGMPHLVVAMAMLRAGKAVNTGDHIPYVICTMTRNEYEATGGTQAAAPNQEAKGKPKSKGSFAERAFHPEEIARSNGVLVVDHEWYLAQQILPPVQRLCEPIEGLTSMGLAEKLGLDATKFRTYGNNGGDDSNLLEVAQLDDSERFKSCDKVEVTCGSCKLEYNFPGVFWLPAQLKAAFEANNEIQKAKEIKETDTRPGNECPRCRTPINLTYLHNVLHLNARKAVEKHYENWNIGDDIAADVRTRQQSVLGRAYTMNGRRVQLQPEYSSRALYTQISYLESLVNTSRALRNLERENEQREDISEPRLVAPTLDKEVAQQFYRTCSSLDENFTSQSAYCWIQPSVFKTIFKLST